METIKKLIYIFINFYNYKLLKDNYYLIQVSFYKL